MCDVCVWLVRTMHVKFRLFTLAFDVGDADIGLKERPVGLKRSTVALMDDAAAFKNEGKVCYAQNLLCVLLDQDRRQTFLANNLAQRG